MMYTQEEQFHWDKNIMDKTILIIEDDDSIGALLVEALSQETPYKALLVTDAFQALKAVNYVKPCLFITDYHLPLMDGIELYDRLHSTNVVLDMHSIIAPACLKRRSRSAT